MQNELNVPSIGTRREKAREWARGNGHAEPSPNAPETSDAPLPTVWWRDYFKWRNLTVAGRDVKGFVISPTIAAVLLAAFLGALGWGYKSNTTDSRETLIAITEMKTLLNERTRVFNEQQAKLESELKDERAVAALQREKAKDKQTEIVYALKEKGIVISQ